MSDGIVGGSPPVDGDRNLAAAINTLNWVVFPLSWVSVALRTVSRVWISHNFGWDDAMMIFCQMTNSVGMGLVMQETFWGLGRHRFYLKKTNYTGFLKYDYLDWVQVFITLMTCKLAICMFLLRISKFKQWRIFIYGLMILLVATHVPLAFCFIFQCKPVNKVWDPDAAPGICWRKETIQNIIIIQGVSSIITDVICAAFPIILLRNMKLPQRQKVALQLLMGLGILTALICIVRTVFSYEVKAEDKTWQGIPNALCRILEINLGIIAANAPMLRPLWNIGRRKWKEHFHSAQATQSTSPSGLQWYRPPPNRVWYKNMRRNFYWRFRPPVSKTSSTQSMNKSSSSVHAEKVNIPPPHPHVKKPSIKIHWPQAYERPENATWAKEEPEPKMSDSIDLPLQGVRSREWEEEEMAKIKEADWGNFRFDRDAP